MRLILCALALGGCDVDGRAPTLEMIDDQVVAVGDELSVNLRATDPDGDALFYDFEADSNRMAESADVLIRPDGTAIFQWTPMAEDLGTWAVDYVVTDGSAEDRVTALVEVTSSAGAAPMFRSPMGSGATLDLETDDCLKLDVVVDDVDDRAVTLEQAEPVIDGAVFEQDSGLTGQWTWCPRAAGRANLVLQADDGTHPAVIKNFLVVVREAPVPDPPKPEPEPPEPEPPEPDPEPCADDDFEDNDSLAEAAAHGALPPGPYPDLVACPGDEDWFRIELAQEGTITAQVTAGAVSLHDHNGDPVDEPSCLPTGAYYVRVVAAELRQPYDLELDKQPCAPS